jgi:hypothetical protein
MPDHNQKEPQVSGMPLKMNNPGRLSVADEFKKM